MTCKFIRYNSQKYWVIALFLYLMGQSCPQDKPAVEPFWGDEVVYKKDIGISNPKATTQPHPNPMKSSAYSSQSDKDDMIFLQRKLNYANLLASLLEDLIKLMELSDIAETEEKKEAVNKFIEEVKSQNLDISDKDKELEELFSSLSESKRGTDRQRAVQALQSAIASRVPLT